MAHEKNQNSEPLPHYNQENPNPFSSSYKKSSIIALCIATSLFMSTLGYDLIQAQEKKEESTPKKSAPLVAYERPILASASSSLHPADDENDLYDELSALRKQNHRQTKKIKALKQELVNKHQEQHDLKATLFKREGDPKDKKQISELSHQLAQRELSLLQLQQQIRDLETEKRQFDKKMQHAEVAQEALATLLEKQRTTKDQEITKLREKLSDLQQKNEHENRELTSRLLQYIDTEQQLKENLENSHFATFYLDSEINRLNSELENHQAEHKAKETALAEKLYDTLAYLELIELESSQLKEKLNSAYVRHHLALKKDQEAILHLENDLNRYKK